MLTFHATNKAIAAHNRAAAVRHYRTLAAPAPRVSFAAIAWTVYGGCLAATIGALIAVAI